jgi:Domain of unknown function (DUF5664)
MAQESVVKNGDTVGIKHDLGKARFHLVPIKPIQDLVDVLEFGANKYSDDNWRAGFDWSRLYDATMRHLFAWYAGEDVAEDSGLNHLAHAMCNIVFLLEFEKTHPERDDRKKYQMEKSL